jgi:hypothetical protein
LATGSRDGTVCLWNADTGELLRHCKEHTATITTLRFSSDDNRLVSGSYDYAAFVWDVQSDLFEVSHRLVRHNDYVRCAVFSRAGDFVATASDDRCVFLWDLKDITSPQLFTGHKEYVRAVALSPDSRWLVSGSDDQSILIWDLTRTPAEDGPRNPFMTYSVGSGVSSLAFNAKGDKFVSLEGESTCRIWSPGSGESTCGMSFDWGRPINHLYVDPRHADYILSEGEARWTPQLITLATAGATADGRPQSPVGSSSPGSSMLTAPKSPRIGGTGSFDPAAFFPLGSNYPDWRPYNLCRGSENEGWLMWKDRRYIYLPPSYRSRSFQVQGHRVAMGTRSGAVLLFRFIKGAEPAASQLH